MFTPTADQSDFFNKEDFYRIFKYENGAFSLWKPKPYSDVYDKCLDLYPESFSDIEHINYSMRGSMEKQQYVNPTTVDREQLLEIITEKQLLSIGFIRYKVPSFGFDYKYSFTNPNGVDITITISHLSYFNLYEIEVSSGKYEQEFAVNHIEELKRIMSILGDKSLSYLPYSYTSHGSRLIYTEGSEYPMYELLSGRVVNSDEHYNIFCENKKYYPPKTFNKKLSDKNIKSFSVETYSISHSGNKSSVETDTYSIDDFVDTFLGNTYDSSFSMYDDESIRNAQINTEINNQTDKSMVSLILKSKSLKVYGIRNNYNAAYDEDPYIIYNISIIK